MPKQVTGVTITNNGDGTATVNIGQDGYQIQITDLFSAAVDGRQMQHNCRLSFLIGGYAQPNSAEFLNGVNQINKGMTLKGGTCVIDSVDLADASVPTYNVTYHYQKGVQRGVSETIQMALTDFNADLGRTDVVIANIASFLQAGKFTSLTAGAIAAINAQQFWY